MECPDCNTKMESQDASALTGGENNVIGVSSASNVVIINYYCRECQEYFVWVKGHPLERHDWSSDLSPEQEAHALIIRELHAVGAGPEC